MMRIFILFFVFGISSCGPTDSGVRFGSSDYYVEDKDHSHIYVTKKIVGRYVVAIDEMVVDYKLIGNKLFVLQKPASTYECLSKNKKPILVTVYTNNSLYWIVNIDTKVELGPFDESKYLRTAKLQGVTAPVLSTPTNYFTNEAMLRTSGSNCVATALSGSHGGGNTGK